MWRSSVTFPIQVLRKERKQNYFLLKQGKWEMADLHFGTVVFKFLRKLSHAE